MKKIFTFLGVIVFVIMLTPMFFSSCETEEDTKVPEPISTFFSAVIGGNNKSIKPGTNGYLIQPYDTCFTDTAGTHYTAGIRLFQSTSGYYVSSREEFKIELVNLLDADGVNKDSLFHAYLSQPALPWYNPNQVADSTKHTGMCIKWRTANGNWYTTSKASQSTEISVDSTKNVTLHGGISTHEVYLKFTCTLYEKGGTKTLTLIEGRGRFSFLNTSFF